VPFQKQKKPSPRLREEGVQKSVIIHQSVKISFFVSRPPSVTTRT
jgi:hypothetical protein